MEDGSEGVFCSRSDGIGIYLLKQTGIPVRVISTEENPVVRARCRKLDIPCVSGCWDKIRVLKKEMKKLKIHPEQVVYVGNDMNDRDCLKEVGVPVCVADAYPEILPYAVYVTHKKGGQGAVREICDLLLEAKHAKLS